MISLILIFFLCLAISAFFSASEMAFVSINKLKLRELSDQGNKHAQVLLRMQQNPQNFLTAVLIGNTILNVTATAIFTYMLDALFGIRNEWIITAILAPILIIFCETVPKDYGRMRSKGFLLGSAGILKFIEGVFHWPVKWILKAVDSFLSSLGAGEHKSIFVSEEEFRVLIEESAHSGVLAHHEKQLVDTILDFERIHIDSVMIPLEKLPKVEIRESLLGVKAIARQSKSRMVLVYEEIPSLVVGMIYVFDLLFEEEENQPLRKYLRSPIFLQRNISIEKAFLTLQEKRQSFAVVTDASGEIIGAVPIERLLVV